ncbi:MAG: glycosyltransferase family protein [Candidatus Limnocylindria bacterium]
MTTRVDIRLSSEAALHPPPGVPGWAPARPIAAAEDPPRALGGASRSPRLIYYCHDTFGLGHLRRTLKIAESMAFARPDASHLVVTGSPVPQRFVLPDAIDYVKLPSVVKIGAERYAARSLAIPFDMVRDLRRQMVSGLADTFRPDLLLVDHAPAGLAGEVLPALDSLRRRSPATQLVLGLRDVIDEPARVRAAWRRDGIYELLDEVYDLILVYGQREVYDIVDAYGLSERAAAKVRYVGYLGARATSPQRVAEVRRGLGLRTDRLVLVTGGGGGDGHAMLATILTALRQEPALGFDCLLVTGPLMSRVEREALSERAAGLRGVTVTEFVEDMPALMAAADAVVSMGGYNSVCELLDCGRPGLLVPRVDPRREQLIRGRALQRRGLLRLVHPNELSVARLMAELRQLLDDPPATERRALAGLSVVASVLAAALPGRGAIGRGAG